MNKVPVIRKLSVGTNSLVDGVLNYHLEVRTDCAIVKAVDKDGVAWPIIKINNNIFKPTQLAAYVPKEIGITLNQKMDVIPVIE